MRTELLNLVGVSLQLVIEKAPKKVELKASAAVKVS
jgi:hypothetical protein